MVKVLVMYKQVRIMQQKKQFLTSQQNKKGMLILQLKRIAGLYHQRKLI